jgi:RNA polymerase sigma-70 factor (ECF subfamily)
VTPVSAALAPPGTEAAIAAVLAGERERYRAVVEAFRVPVTMVVAAIVPDPGCVDEVAYETFWTAYSKLREYTPGTDFGAWIKAIARRLAWNERRRWLAEERTRRGYQQLLEEDAGPLADAFAAAVGAQTRALIEGCIERLQPATRRLVERYYFEGRPGPEIAREERRTESWVRVSLLRARVALAACLESKGVLPHG